MRLGIVHASFLLAMVLPTIGSGEASVNVPPVVGRQPAGFNLSSPDWSHAIAVSNGAYSPAYLRLYYSELNYWALNDVYAFHEYAPILGGQPTWAWYNVSRTDFERVDWQFYQGQPAEWSTSFRGWINAPQAVGVSPITIIPRVNGAPPMPTQSALFDARTDEQRANAPKLDPEDTDIRFWRGPGGWLMTAQGRVTDPGHAFNGVLTLEYSDGISAERQTISIRVHPDGTFYESRIPLRLNDQRLANVRPLLLYRRQSGETVNLGYFGNANEITTSTFIYEYLRDSLRNLIGRNPKSTSSRFPETRVLNTMGVKG